MIWNSSSNTGAFTSHTRFLTFALAFAIIAHFDWSLRAEGTAALTPLDALPAPGTEMTIVCAYEGRESFAAAGMRSKPAQGLFHYQLYLPAGYDPAAAHPVIFFMSPGGNARPGALKEFADAHGWLVVGLTEAKNGPWEPIMGNFLAAHDDLVQRCKIAEGRKYATGFSGGARGSSLFVQLRPGFGGVLLQGAGFWFDERKYGLKKLPPGCRVAMIMGTEDNNHKEATDLQKALPKSQPFRLWEWPGGHRTPPEDLRNEALLWMSGES